MTNSNFSHFLYDDILIVTLEGDVLGVNNEADLVFLVEKYIQFSITNTIVDLSIVDYMNSTGLSFLIRILNQIKKANGKLIVVNSSEQVGKLLEITKLDRIFTLTNTRGEALKFFN